MALAGSAAKVFCVVGNAHTLYAMWAARHKWLVYERACVMRQLPMSSYTIMVVLLLSVIVRTVVSTTSTIQFTIAYTSMIVGTGTSTIADSRDVYLDRSLSTTIAVVASTTW